MIKGFRDFILRGKVVDLAIAVVIGGAFTGIVTQLTKSFIEPLLKVFGGGGLNSGAFMIHGVAFDWAAFLNAIINFLIVTAVLYFLIVTPMNKIILRRQRSEGVSPAPIAAPEDIELLKEIRDLLKKQSA